MELNVCGSLTTAEQCSQFSALDVVVYQKYRLRQLINSEVVQLAKEQHSC